MCEACYIVNQGKGSLFEPLKLSAESFCGYVWAEGVDTGIKKGNENSNIYLLHTENILVYLM